MKLAIDVYYYDSCKAKVVGVIFDKWESEKPHEIVTTSIEQVEDYEAGKFYKRELPCILKLLESVNMDSIDTIVIDGYVYLDAPTKAGLGMHLYNSLGEKIPIIGVAKTYFHENIATKVFRGKSKNPLYITSIGVEISEAAAHIHNMHGAFRMPTLLKLLDYETRTKENMLF